MPFTTKQIFCLFRLSNDFISYIMTDTSEIAKKKFWDRYLSVLTGCNIKQQAQRWYVIHIEII